MGRTKGVGLVNVRRFTVERAGEEGWSRVLAALPPHVREEVDGAVAVGWYDIASYAKLLRAVDETLGRGDRTVLRALGRYGAEHDFTTIHRVFLRVASPAYVIEKVGSVWARFYDVGRWEIVRQGSNGLTATLYDMDVVDDALCAEQEAYLGRVLELVGAGTVDSRHVACRAKGAAACTWETSWAR